MTAEQVLNSFNKWKESATPVQVTCLFRGTARPATVRVTVYGLVKVVDDSTIVVSAEDGSSIQMSLRNCQFKSGKNVVADAPKDVIVEVGLSEMLEIDFPTGEMCIVSAYRPVN